MKLLLLTIAVTLTTSVFTQSLAEKYIWKTGVDTSYLEIIDGSVYKTILSTFDSSKAIQSVTIYPTDHNGNLRTISKNQLLDLVDYIGQTENDTMWFVDYRGTDMEILEGQGAFVLPTLYGSYQISVEELQVIDYNIRISIILPRHPLTGEYFKYDEEEGFTYPALK